ncbi:hepatic lectin-like [Hemiscyllium ocellatum]|uniref:hepatic lectin-like n=1 Tax=Hemiscyllium ocellatum TaxID=170820 RepID=UPI00296734D3|nr:hepatic lectin-like [Hemiscyllium ocellatum]
MDPTDAYECLTDGRLDQLKKGRGDQELAEYRGWSRELTQRKWSPLVIYLLLGVSILLSVVILGTVFKLSRGTSEQTESFIAELRNEISQLKENLLHIQLPDQWSQGKQRRYYFSTQKTTWKEAQTFCESMGAHLVVINNAEEQMYLQQNGRCTNWIGLHDTVEEGKWRWVDGTDYDSNMKFWDSSQPNGHEEDCVVMSCSGQWHDWPCDSIHTSICEKSA